MWWFLLYWVIGYISIVLFYWLALKEDIYLKYLIFHVPIASFWWPLLLPFLIFVKLEQSGYLYIDFNTIILKGKRTDIED